MKRIVVVGATGDVGQGMVAGLLERGWRVVAVGRTAERLAKVAGEHSGAALQTVVGDLSSEAGALAIWEAASAGGAIDAAVVTVNARNQAQPMLDWTGDGLLGVFETNLVTHFNAAKAFLPRLPDDGVFLGIGGGTADFVIPKMGQLSMSQAAQRMMYRAIARERKGGAAIRELMIVSMVNGESKRDQATPDWITDVEIGRHAGAIIADPAAFPGPILVLRDKAQIGRSEAAQA